MLRVVSLEYCLVCPNYIRGRAILAIKLFFYFNV